MTIGAAAASVRNDVTLQTLTGGTASLTAPGFLDYAAIGSLAIGGNLDLSKQGGGRLVERRAYRSCRRSDIA